MKYSEKNFLSVCKVTYIIEPKRDRNTIFCVSKYRQQRKGFHLKQITKYEP